MERFLTTIVLGSAAIAQLTTGHGQSPGMAQANVKPRIATGDSPALPDLPRGKSTILGGEIRSLDPVLDQFTLNVLGQRPLKILFDERTQVYIDGKRSPLRDLRSNEHASVETVLDGADVFAISIHMLSQTPDGECQGHVSSYNPDTRELTLGSSLSREPIRLLLRDNTPVVRQGQSAFTASSAGMADLVKGALVAVTFEPNDHGRAVASHVTVLALPGADFAFSGRISSLDIHSGILVVVDPRDEKSYPISFDPLHTPAGENLRIGSQVRVSASYDGVRYTANEIDVGQPSQR